MTYMSQPLSGGLRTWRCGCGRLGLAVALQECPACGAGRPEGVAAELAGPSPVLSPAPLPVRRRTRTRKAAPS